MKRWMVLVSGLVVAVMLATMSTGTALAWGGPEGRGSGSRGRGFVDADGDGVNDRYATCNGTGECDGAGAGYRFGFVDEDGDGVNDRYGTCDGTGECDGTGAGAGFRFGFVDEDGDGVNDRYVEGQGCVPLADGSGMARRGGRWSR